MGHNSSTIQTHDRLSYNGNFVFEDFSAPRIVFTDTEVKIGCKAIGRDAFEELYQRYQRFLKRPSVEVVQP